MEHLSTADRKPIERLSKIYRRCIKHPSSNQSNIYRKSIDDQSSIDRSPSHVDRASTGDISISCQTSITNRSNIYRASKGILANVLQMSVGHLSSINRASSGNKSNNWQHPPEIDLTAIKHLSEAHRAPV